MSRHDIPVLAAIREQLVGGIRDLPDPVERRRRRYLVAAPAAAVLAVVVALLPGVMRSGGAVAYALDVLADGRIHVEVHPDFDDVRRLEADLTQAGVDVQVATTPAHPGLVGVIELVARDRTPDGVTLGRGEFWVDPARFRGTVEIVIFTEAAPGERWAQAPSVFHPDEPLGGLPCALDGPLTTEVLEGLALEAGISEITWLVSDPLVRQPERDAVDVERRPEGEVWAAWMIAPGELMVQVRPPEAVATNGPTPPLSMWDGRSGTGDAACTPSLAQRWGGVP